MDVSAVTKTLLNTSLREAHSFVAATIVPSTVPLGRMNVASPKFKGNKCKDYRNVRGFQNAVLEPLLQTTSCFPMLRPVGAFTVNVYHKAPLINQPEKPKIGRLKAFVPNSQNARW